MKTKSKMALQKELLKKCQDRLDLLMDRLLEIDAIKNETQQEIKKASAEILKLQGIKVYEAYDYTGNFSITIKAKNYKQALRKVREEMLESGSFWEPPIRVRLMRHCK